MSLYEGINNHINNGQMFKEGPQVYSGTVEELSNKIKNGGVLRILSGLKPEVKCKIKIDEDKNHLVVDTEYFTAWDGEIPEDK